MNCSTFLFKQLVLSCSIVILHSLTLAAAELPDTVDFNFHIKPILSDRCFFCHGPDAENRQADFRLDTPEGLFKALEGEPDKHYLKPGNPDESDLFLRITEQDDDLVMPPKDSNVSLSTEEIALIKKWIEQGAEWKEHWSFLPIQIPELPKVKQTDWPRNHLDHFVLKKLEQIDWNPSPEATREMWLRRVTFDLTGLPPTLDELDQFLADQSDNAYDKIVDRLLASSKYGERMAVDWLDLARYADTYGYQSDVYRAMWPWRDWVVKAFNQNLPFDQFITWQLAGDLLPNPTREQILATAFNRHHRQTNEGGSINEEYRVEYVADRTLTFGTAFLGLTLDCSRCHDHKYDPVTQKEFYQLSAYFNSIDESGLYSHFTQSMPTPSMMLADETQTAKQSETQEQITAAEKRLPHLTESQRELFAQWLNKPEKQAMIPGLVGDYPFEAIKEEEDEQRIENRADPALGGKLSESPKLVEGQTGKGLQLSGENNFTTNVGGKFTRNQPFTISLWMKTDRKHDRAVIFHRSRAWTDAASRGYQLLFFNGKLDAGLIHFWPGNAIRIRTQQEFPINEWVHVTMSYDGSSKVNGLKIYANGQQLPVEIIRDELTKEITGGGSEEIAIGQRFRDRGFKNGLVDEFQIYNRELTSIEVAQVANGSSLNHLLQMPSDKLTQPERAQLFEYYLSTANETYQQELKSLQALREQRSEVTNKIAEVMVMRELPEQRPTYFLHRGGYDARGEQVGRGTPVSLPPFKQEWSQDRLGLAKWLTDPSHPLTARVTVNRFWQSLFGQGFVTTPEDFGNQGALPTHPDLLDYLAKTYIDSGWDTKALLKAIVLSATYRQSSVTTKEKHQQDPLNQQLSRGPRFRLPAEMIRDNALFVSGLLSEKQGGAPVKPYQPAGLWKEKSNRDYTRDEGEGSRRRSLYTYWKRTSPPPSMVTFDAAEREICTAKRQTTATPLQALILLNDPQYLEAAKAIAEQTLITENQNLDQQLTTLFRKMTSRYPDDNELNILKQLHEEQLKHFQQNPEDAKQLLTVGDLPPNDQLEPPTHAAMMVVAQLLLNYDEVSVKH